MTPSVHAVFCGAQHPEDAERSFNLSTVIGEQEDIERNRDALIQLLGTPVVLTRQVHGNDVVIVNDVPPANTLEVRGRADAVVASVPGVHVGVLTADCVPILLTDGKRVVAAAHAGRRGLQAGIIESTLEAMRNEGAASIRAVIGPCICGRCYEVPLELQEEYVREVPNTASVTSWGTPALDLVAGATQRLQDLGVDVETTDICTLEDDRFFSYRRSPQEGRHGSFIALMP